MSRTALEIRHGRMGARTREMIRLAGEGHTTNEVAAMVGVTRRAVNNVAARYKVHFTSEGERTVARVRACAERGMSPGEIAAHLGMDRTTVQKIKRLHGIEMETRYTRLAKAKAERTEAERAALMARWNARLAERRAALPVTPPADPVDILVTHIRSHGPLSPRAVARVPEHILGAAMARLSGRAALQEARG